MEDVRGRERRDENAKKPGVDNTHGLHYDGVDNRFAGTHAGFRSLCMGQVGLLK